MRGPINTRDISTGETFIGDHMACESSPGCRDLTPLASGNHESAGKRRTGRTTPGNRWLKSALVPAAWAAYPAKGTHLSRKFRRIAASRGEKRAAVTVAHTILVIISHLLKERMDYREIVGENEAA